MKSFFVIALVALLALSASVAAQEVDLSTSLEGFVFSAFFSLPILALYHLVSPSICLELLANSF